MHVFWGVSEEKGEFFLEGTWFGGLDTGEEMSILGHGHGSRDLDAQPCTAMHSHVQPCSSVLGKKERKGLAAGSVIVIVCYRFIGWVCPITCNSQYINNNYLFLNKAFTNQRHPLLQVLG